MFLLGKCGCPPWPAKVVLVATHADLVAPQDVEAKRKDCEATLAHAKQLFGMDFDFIDHVFVLDARKTLCPELWNLQYCLSKAKGNKVKHSKTSLS